MRESLKSPENKDKFAFFEKIEYSGLSWEKCARCRVDGWVG